MAPRRCGIATFSTDLTRAVQQADAAIVVRVAAIDSANTVYPYGPEMHWRVPQGRRESFRRLANALNRADVDLVSLQHEFSLYGTWDGTWSEQFDDHIAPFLMTGFARQLLTGTYRIDTAKVHVVKPGARAVERSEIRALKYRMGLGGWFVISTFGFPGPPKGIQVMIQAMRSVVSRQPNAMYLIIGVTHPGVVAQEHETYRDRLRDLVHRYGLQENVRFINRFLTDRDIATYLLASDLDPHQVSSGTLASALGAGKAVVSTRYAHAAEVLDGGRGILVGFNDPGQLAESVIGLAESADRRRELEQRAYQYGRTASWPLIGTRMAALYHAVTGCCAR